MEILDDYRAPKREKHLEGFVPYVNLSNEEIADVMAVLEEHKIEFKLQKIMGSTNSTFLVPLSSTQLSQNRTLIYILEGQDKDKIDAILDAYYQGPGKRHLEEFAKQEAAAKDLSAVETKQKKWAFFNLAFLFLLIVLIWSFVEFYY